MRAFARSVAALATGALSLSLVTGVAAPEQAQAAPSGDKKVTAVLFEWQFDSVARECVNTLGPEGYGYVQVSPPNERIQGSAWWTAYQPVSYRIGNRLGTDADFREMVTACNNAGVDVIVDAVINHMTSGSGTGTAGTVYSKYNYPGHYQDQDFHGCRRDIGTNYGDRYNVQECELVGLADLNTSSEYVRSEIAEYLNYLISLGVDGFRVDAVKHIATNDLRAIKNKLTNPNIYWVQEAIYGAGEAVSPSEYLQNGDVQEFRYATDLKRIFTGENLAYLSNFGESWGYMASGQSGTFVANHDTERNGSTLSYKDGATYTLANVFMLAWPYGTPSVHSGYEFSNNDAGPPNNGHVNACYQDGWRCQHAWSQIANMVGFRNAVGDAAVTNWWSNGGDAIAFGRGSAGYVAINHENSSLTRTFQTSLPAGTYCDVQHGEPTADGGCTGTTYTVNSAGQFTATIGAHDAVALYVGATGNPGSGNPDSGTGTTAASFGVNATTTWGQNVYVVGNHPSLGSWSPAGAVALSSSTYPVWRQTVSLPAGTYEYKYIKKDAAGNVVWESGANRSVTVTSGGTITLNDTWRS
ncbi:carbohydrate-binding module family 20 domain-containing protein [Allostreptomyces psammosilenae]|uniref:carbohydrate-binding module family 20 domain-containing protein n=1 Tax=Allostreptomyces psammosilenae TaxID=1892865 RepID=UPI0028AF8A16|nr:carbohydrate-binding module family 20 domain-containing protein [Allostreptomyces psammosilenae]